MAGAGYTSSNRRSKKDNTWDTWIRNHRYDRQSRSKYWQNYQVPAGVKISFAVEH